MVLVRSNRQQQEDKQRQLALIRSAEAARPVDGTRSEASGQDIDVGLQSFWIGVALRKVFACGDEGLIALIVEYARPACPRLALLGTCCVRARGSIIQREHANFDAATVHIIASDGDILACALTDPSDVLVWNLAAEGSGRPSAYSGIPTPITSMWVSESYNVLVVGCAFGSVLVWALSTGAFLCGCDYYEWADRSATMGLGHYHTVVTTVGGGSVFSAVSCNIISGDEVGVLCVWELGSTGGLAKFCVNVAHQVDSSSCIITCCACRQGLVVCGLRDGLALGYFASSGKCAFVLAVPTLVPVLTIGLMQCDSCEAMVLGCLADGSVLWWSIAGHMDCRAAYDSSDVLPPELFARNSRRSSGRDLRFEALPARAHLVQRNSRTTVVWVGEHEPASLRYSMRWAEFDRHGGLSIFNSSLSLPKEFGELEALVQV